MIEWNVPFSLISPQGTMLINDQDPSTGGYYMLDRTKCVGGPTPLRVVSDPIPQGDGGILHSGWKSAYSVQLGMQFWEAIGEEGTPACEDLLRSMWDNLGLHLGALLNPTLASIEAGSCRLQWTPTGVEDRILDRIQLLEWPNPDYDEAITGAVFQIFSPFPYAAGESVTEVSPSATVTNGGNAEYWPVVRVDGPVTSFTLSNTTLGLDFVYLGAAIVGGGGIDIPGGSYAEIDMFRNTIYLNGDSSNLKASLDLTASDFFPLAPGPNVITFSGSGSPTIFARDGWA